jgi:hypothetical protein
MTKIEKRLAAVEQRTKPKATFVNPIVITDPDTGDPLTPWPEGVEVVIAIPWNGRESVGGRIAKIGTTHDGGSVV